MTNQVRRVFSQIGLGLLQYPLDNRNQLPFHQRGGCHGSGHCDHGRMGRLVDEQDAASFRGWRWDQLVFEQPPLQPVQKITGPDGCQQGVNIFCPDGRQPAFDFARNQQGNDGPHASGCQHFIFTKPRARARSNRLHHRPDNAVSLRLWREQVKNIKEFLPDIIAKLRHARPCQSKKSNSSAPSYNTADNLGA